MFGSKDRHGSAASLSPAEKSPSRTGSKSDSASRGGGKGEEGESRSSLIGRTLLGRRPSRSKRGHSKDDVSASGNVNGSSKGSLVVAPMIVAEPANMTAEPASPASAFPEYVPVVPNKSTAVERVAMHPTPLPQPPSSTPSEPVASLAPPKPRGLFRGRQAPTDPANAQQQQQQPPVQPPSSGLMGWFRSSKNAAGKSTNATTPSSNAPPSKPFTTTSQASSQLSPPTTTKTADQIAAAAAVASLLANGGSGGTAPSLPPANGVSNGATLAALLQNPNAVSADEPEGLVFCTDLLLATTRSGKEGVPMVVLACVEFLDQFGLATEGLYRIPGSHKRVKEWQERFEEAAAQSSPESTSLGVVQASPSCPSWKVWSGLTLVTDDSNSHSPPTPPPKSPVLGSAATPSDLTLQSPPQPSANAAPSTVNLYLEILSNLTSPEADPRTRWSALPPTTVGPVVVFEGEGSATVASVLKRFLIKIKGGLVGKTGFWERLEDEILDTASPLPLTLRIRRTMLERLPTSSHLATLAHLFAHLNRVSHRSADNKMTAKNLAISLFPQGITGAEYLIERYDEVFFK
ncbi:hypothetical protein HDU67_005921 [Dinochytrium kinnereticum]|nr:hypothetical protein HDU67_005921 [Dinochytrium kinnereticum]